MRLSRLVFAGGVVLLAGALLASPEGSRRAAPAQAADMLLPEQSAAKARELVQRAIEALGGQGYLVVRDFSCEGRFAQFSTQGDVGGYAKIHYFVLLPDKVRTEYYLKRNIIEVNNGDKAWSMDRAGVQEEPPVVVERFREGLKKDVDQLFRYRLNEEGLIFRYRGTDLLDLKEIEWIEVIDRDRRSTRIAFEKSTHRPIRAVYVTRDPETRERFEEVEYFANYHALDGVMTPTQLWRERNGKKFFQVFWEGCHYNTNLSESFFTREALEEAFAKFNKGKKKKK